jgi:hypothetical protein
MSRDEQISLDFAELIDRALDGTITAEQFALLDHQIATNEKACAYYQEFITTYVGLMDLQGVLPKTFDVPWQEMLYGPDEEGATSNATGYPDIYYFEPDVTEEEKKRQIEIYASEQLNAYLKQQYKDIIQQETSGTGWDLREAVDGFTTKLGAFLRTGSKVVKITAICSLAMLLFIVIVSLFHGMFVPGEIATLSTSLNARLSDNQNVVSGARLTNRKYPLFLQTGLIEIVFDGGAKVLLEAPAAFRLKSAESMVLHTGQLFASVPDYAKGFTVDTPNSHIMDLGTEFGIRVEQDGTSDLHMFQGKAELTSASGGKEGRRLTLVAGQAKRIDTGGQVGDIPIKEQAFVRHFYSKTGFVWRGQGLSLVDLVARGNGLGTGRTDVYVDPIEGYEESLYCNGKGNEYHALASNPFIDGLFIPDGSKEQIISSLGHEFVDCPQTNGECYANLGANPKQRAWATDMRTGIVRFDGHDYGNQKNPCFVMHANLGITFDLNAVRAMCPGINVIRFVSKIGIADFDESSGCNADFWVLVDGKVRYGRPNVKQKGVLSNVAVELILSDRFLTLVTTDGGDVDRLGAYQRSYTCDWCVFVEPALVLETTEDVNIQAK